VSKDTKQSNIRSFFGPRYITQEHPMGCYTAYSDIHLHPSHYNLSYVSSLSILAQIFGYIICKLINASKPFIENVSLHPPLKLIAPRNGPNMAESIINIRFLVKETKRGI